MHRIRQRLISSRTGLANQMRGLLSDYGIIFSKSHHKILQSLPLLIEDMQNNLSFTVRELMSEMLEELKYKNLKIAQIEDKLKTHSAK